MRVKKKIPGIRVRRRVSDSVKAIITLEEHNQWRRSSWTVRDAIFEREGGQSSSAQVAWVILNLEQHQEEPRAWTREKKTMTQRPTDRTVSASTRHAATKNVLKMKTLVVPLFFVSWLQRQNNNRDFFLKKSLFYPLVFQNFLFKSKGYCPEHRVPTCTSSRLLQLTKFLTKGKDGRNSTGKNNSR